MKKYEVIAEKMKSDILNGYLKKGDSLHSIRKCADVFHVSKITIEHAYDLLSIEGYIKSIPKKGFIVNVSDDRIKLHKQIQEYDDTQIPEDVHYDFRLRSVWTEGFEIKIWNRYIKAVLEDKQVLSTYGNQQGEYELRQALSQYVYKNRGILCTPEDILVGSNYQTLLFIVCSLLDSNLVIAMERKNNLQAQAVFSSYGFKIVYLNDDWFDELCHQHVDVLYINPSSQSKYQTLISDNLRDRLLAYTKVNDILILEDDYNGELTYRSRHRQSMYSFSNADNVIYFGSFSRLLLPSLRISYIVFNRNLKTKYLNKLDSYGPSASKIEQLAFSKYIEDGHLDKHLRKLKREYSEKSIYMESLLKKYFSIPFYLNEAYLAYFAFVDKEKLQRFYQLCSICKIGISTSYEDHLQLSFTNISLEMMEEGICLLAKLFKEC